MVFDKIKEIIIEQLGVDEADVTPETSLTKDLEADSLDAVEIIMAIEEEYGIEVPDEEAKSSLLSAISLSTLKKTLNSSRGGLCSTAHVSDIIWFKIKKVK